MPEEKDENIYPSDLIPEAEALEKRIAIAAQQAGRGPVGKALNVAATQAGLVVGMLLVADTGGAAVGSG